MEKKFSFLDYAWEIYLAARTNGVDIGVGYDMFRADVKIGHNSNCGEALKDFNFHAAQGAWDRLTASEQMASYDEWRGFNGRAFKALSEAFTAGDREAFDAAVTAVREADADEQD